MANEEKKNTFKSQWKLNIKTSKPPEARVTESWLVLALHLIGWVGGASFLDQSQSEVEQNQWNLGLLSTLNRKLR